MKNTNVKVHALFDPVTWTMTYIVYDLESRDAVVIDPVWDYDPAASKLSTESLENVWRFIKDESLNLHYILETHAHADHVTGAQELKIRFPKAKIGINENIIKVQKSFHSIFNLGQELKTDGSQFDLLLNESEIIFAGKLQIKTIFTPGHTPACSSFLINDNLLFTGDALFMPDFGTGRCDFPEGSAKELFHSIKDKLYTLPDETRVFVGHDYQPNGRPVRFESTIAEEKKSNLHIQAETIESEFVNFRTARDKTLKAPRLLLPSIQININAGNLPLIESNGGHFLKIPVR